MTIESYRGEKHDLCWDKIFEDEELNKKYELTEELKKQLKATTKGHVSSLMENINSVSTRKTVSSDPSNPAPKKRGRKSKAEKEEMLRQQERLEREAMMQTQLNNEDPSDDDIEYEENEYEDSVDNDADE